MNNATKTFPVEVLSLYEMNSNFIFHCGKNHVICGSVDVRGKSRFLSKRRKEKKEAHLSTLYLQRWLKYSFI